MKKPYRKIATVLLSAIILFSLGFSACYFLFFERNATKENVAAVTDFATLPRDMELEKLYNSAISEEEMQVASAQQDYLLSSEDLDFLEKHLFGQWKFTERVIVLNEEDNNHYNTTSNISSIGEEEIIKYMSISFGKEWIEITAGRNQGVLSNAADVFFLGEYGGFQSVRNPAFTIKEQETDIINLYDMYYWKQYQDYRYEGAETFYKINYFAPTDGQNTSKTHTRYFASPIYVDPEDSNTIYVEFCGLWRLERDDTNYSTGTKSPIG